MTRVSVSASPAKRPPPLAPAPLALLMTVTSTRVSGLPLLANRPPPSFWEVLLEMTRFCSRGWADPVISTAPPQAAGQATPNALPAKKVRPEIRLLLPIAAPVMVMTRWPGRARKKVVA